MAAAPLVPRGRAILILILVTLLWGASFPLMKFVHLLQGQHLTTALPRDDVAVLIASALLFTALRFAIALFCFAVWLPRQVWSLSRREMWSGALIGVAFLGGFVPQLLGLHEIPASRSGFLTSLAAVFTPLLAMVWLRQLPRGAVALGVAMALFGTALLTGLVELHHRLPRIAPDAISHWGRGDALTTLGAALFAVQILLIDYFARRDPSARLTAGMLAAVALLAALGFVLILLLQPALRDVRAWWALAQPSYLCITFVMSIVCTVLAFDWMNRYQAHVSPTQAAVIYTLEPVFATLWAMYLPDLLSPILGLDYRSEQLSTALVLGGFFVVIGNFFTLRPEPAPTAPTATTTT